MAMTLSDAAANSCKHSLLKCGECRAQEVKPVVAVKDLEQQIAQLTSQLVEAKKAANDGPVGEPIRLDLGCGNASRRKNNQREKGTGWIGVDLEITEGGADIACNLGKDPWPWADSSVDEVLCHHMLEHLKAPERIHFMDELYRVLKPGAKAQIVTPHWASSRAYGDLTHEWPPVVEMFYAYLDKDWRKDNAPHTPYHCDFHNVIAYSTAPWLAGRHPDYVNECIRDHKEAAGDMMVTLTARKG